MTLEQMPHQKNILPDCITESLFVALLQENVANFKHIKSINTSSATSAGDNYMSSMLKVDIEAQLNDDTITEKSFMLKLPAKGEEIDFFLTLTDSFEKEEAVYSDILPKFEAIYQNVGVNIMFSPKNYKFSKSIPTGYLLLENLRPLGYRNENRLVGLDVTHTKSVLQLLARFHAASAYYFAKNSNVPELFTKGYFTKDTEGKFGGMYIDLINSLYECAKTYEGCEEYIDKIPKFHKNIIDIMTNIEKVNDQEFNVLNHGDCWTNNILFQYDAAGNLIDTKLIDYQLPIYGSPAFDLYFFLISSTTFENKIEQFDYFIRYYHEYLEKNLKLLKYPREIPSLKDLHITLLKGSVYGFSTILDPMAASLIDPSNDATVENFFGQSDSNKTFQKEMFGNPRYAKHAAVVLKWLNRRGLFD